MAKIRERSSEASDGSDLDAYGRAVINELKTALGNVGIARELPAPADFVRMGLSIRRPRHPLADIIGPMYSSAGTEKVSGLSRQQLADRRGRGTILALRTSDGQFVYPVFQFDRGAIRPSIRQLLDIFRHDNPDWWTVAAWITAGKDELGGDSPLERVTDSTVPPEVRDLAGQAATRWAA